MCSMVIRPIKSEENISHLSIFLSYDSEMRHPVFSFVSERSFYFKDFFFLQHLKTILSYKSFQRKNNNNKNNSRVKIIIIKILP